MNKQEFISYIYTQDSFKQLINNYKPNLIFITGSCGVGTNLPTSDYDLVAIAPKWAIKSILGCEDVNLSNDRNIPAHCYVYSNCYYMDWFNQTHKYPNRIIRDTWFHNCIALQDNNNIVYKANDADVSFWLQNQQTITKLCVEQLFTTHWQYQLNNVKFLAHCWLGLEVILNKTYDYNQIKYIKQLQSNEEEQLFNIRKELLQKWNELQTVSD